MIDRRSIRVEGARAIENAWAAAAATADARAARLVDHHAQLLKTTIQAKASGRPGPNAPTGDYRRSWTVTKGRVNGDHAAIVGTMKPQGRRLEFGFTGVDSLGRYYDQQPYPHVNPAADIIEPMFVRSLIGIAGSA